MHRLSIVQALSVWDDLSSAYYNDNSYAGAIAEIYIYKVMPFEPTVAHTTPANRPPPGGPIGDLIHEAHLNANATLRNILEHFAISHDAEVLIELDNPGIFHPLTEWDHTTVLFEHRVHIKVTPKSSTQRRIG
jgi:hypothetical protein